MRGIKTAAGMELASKLTIPCSNRSFHVFRRFVASVGSVDAMLDEPTLSRCSMSSWNIGAVSDVWVLMCHVATLMWAYRRRRVHKPYRRIRMDLINEPAGSGAAWPSARSENSFGPLHIAGFKATVVVG